MHRARRRDRWRGPEGRADDQGRRLLQGPLTTALARGRDADRDPRCPPGGHGGAAYMKFPHPASRFAVVGVAAARDAGRGGKCTARPASGITGAGTKAVRAKGVEAALAGKTARRGVDRGGRPEGGRGRRRPGRPPGLGRVQGAPHARVRAAGARARGRAGQGREVARDRAGRRRPGLRPSTGSVPGLRASVRGRGGARRDASRWRAASGNRRPGDRGDRPRGRDVDPDGAAEAHAPDGRRAAARPGRGRAGARGAGSTTRSSSWAETRRRSPSPWPRCPCGPW